MRREVGRLDERSFDVVVIGGGITGAFLALDASTRGLSVAIIEKGDWGGATSSASSKLIHGGIRYLQQGRVDKVRESALERAYFQILAPHHHSYVPFLIPSYKGIRKGKGVLAVGVAAYELLCQGQNGIIRDPTKKVPRSHTLSKGDVLDILPGINAADITGGMVIYESQMHDSERMTLSVVKTAAREGAVAANYVQFDSFIHHGSRIAGVRAHDRESGEDLEIRSSTVLNAAGPWIPSIHRSLHKKAALNLLKGFARGSHIVTRPLSGEYALALPTSSQHQSIVHRGGRHVFVIPWRNRSLIGTSYSSHDDDLDEVRPTNADITELLELVNSAVGGSLLQREDVLAAYAGIYPLTAQRLDPSLYQGTGKYEVVDHGHSDGAPGLISVFGAKYTTARLLAERALDHLVKSLSVQTGPCRTRRITVTGGNIENLDDYRVKKKRDFENFLSASLVEHLIRGFGTHVDRVAMMIKDEPALGNALSPKHDVIGAEIVYAARNEMAVRLDDVVFRRTNLGILGDICESTLVKCARLMATELGWTEREVNQQVTETRLSCKQRHIRLHAD